MSQLLQVVPLSKIHPPKYKIRDPGILEELKASMKEKGLLQPVVVRPKNGGFEVVAGHRRYVCAIELGWKEIAVNLIEATDKEAFEIALMENVQRKTMTYREEGEAFRRYCIDFGWGGQTELANKLGISNRTVSERIAFAESDESIIHNVESGKISLSHAEELGRLDTEQATQIMDKVVQHGMDITKTRVAVNAVKAGLNVDQAIHHVLNFPDVPLQFKEKIDARVDMREHVALSVKKAIKSIMFYLEEMPDGPEKREWNEQVLWPLKKLENVAIRLGKEFNNGSKH